VGGSLDDVGRAIADNWDCPLWRGRQMDHGLWRGWRPGCRRRVEGNWIAVYGGDFGKYANVLYVLINKWIYVVYFS
jgi:hypothetical protein